MRNVNSVFPDAIDERIFFSDVDLEHLELMQTYQNLIKQSKYTEASELLNNSDASFYGAWILNLLENRLHNIGDYLINNENIEKPPTNLYQDNAPESIENNLVWIGN